MSGSSIVQIVIGIICGFALLIASLGFLFCGIKRRPALIYPLSGFLYGLTFVKILLGVLNYFVHSHKYEFHLVNPTYETLCMLLGGMLSAILCSKLGQSNRVLTKAIIGAGPVLLFTYFIALHIAFAVHSIHIDFEEDVLRTVQRQSGSYTIVHTAFRRAAENETRIAFRDEVLLCTVISFVCSSIAGLVLGWKVCLHSPTVDDKLSNDSAERGRIERQSETEKDAAGDSTSDSNVRGMNSRSPASAFAVLESSPTATRVASATATYSPRDSGTQHSDVPSVSVFLPGKHQQKQVAPTSDDEGTVEAGICYHPSQDESTPEPAPSSRSIKLTVFCLISWSVIGVAYGLALFFSPLTQMRYFYLTNADSLLEEPVVGRILSLVFLTFVGGIVLWIVVSCNYLLGQKCATVTIVRF